MYLILQAANGIEIWADCEAKNKCLQKKKAESERSRLAGAAMMFT